jgi:hypothetical protein
VANKIGFAERQEQVHLGAPVQHGFDEQQLTARAGAAEARGARAGLCV